MGGGGKGWEEMRGCILRCFVGWGGGRRGGVTEEWEIFKRVGKEESPEMRMRAKTRDLWFDFCLSQPRKA